MHNEDKIVTEIVALLSEFNRVGKLHTWLNGKKDIMEKHKISLTIWYECLKRAVCKETDTGRKYKWKKGPQ